MKEKIKICPIDLAAHDYFNRRMKLSSRVFLIILLIGVYYYLLIPDPPFPNPLADSTQSTQGSDVETPFRRGYYTNTSRDEAITHYLSQLDHLPTLKFIYPPEDAQSAIRDQTQSNYLAEYVHPFRGSVFFNSYNPPDNVQQLYFEDVLYEQKIIIRYVTSSPIVRITVVTLSLFLLKLIIGQWIDLVKNLWKIRPKLV